ncbi:MAG: recombinase family protein [bacterium]
MKARKRAIGYVCDIPAGGTDVAISREDQKLGIVKHAAEQNLDLVCIFEDELFTENPLARAGINKALNCGEEYDVLLVERVWALSRKMRELNPLLDRLDSNRTPLVATSYLWDVASQRLRHRHSEPPAERCGREARAQAAARNRMMAA